MPLAGKMVYRATTLNFRAIQTKSVVRPVHQVSMASTVQRLRVASKWSFQLYKYICILFPLCICIVHMHSNKGLQIVVVRIPAFARISALVGAGRLNYLIQPCANPLAGRMKVWQARNYTWL